MLINIRSRWLSADNLLFSLSYLKIMCKCPRPFIWNSSVILAVMKPTTFWKWVLFQPSWYEQTRTLEPIRTCTKIRIIWDMMPCRLANNYQHFKLAWCLHLQSNNPPSLTLLWLSCKWRKQALPMHWQLITSLHGLTFQKTWTFINTTVRTSNHRTGLYPLPLHLSMGKEPTLKTVWFLYKELGQKIPKWAALITVWRQWWY